jgi:hypothetical protein
LVAISCNFVSFEIIAILTLRHPLLFLANLKT